MSTLIEQPSARRSLRMSEQEFVAWADEDTHAEWVAGEVQLKKPIEEQHDEIQALIRQVVETLAKRRRLGKVRGPQFTMRLPEKPSRRDPDVLFVASSSLDRLKPTVLEGPADLVVEVVSPESQLRDYHEKFAEYEAGGVREYWIVSPMARTIDLFTRDENTGAFIPVPRGGDGCFRSLVVPGFSLHPDELFNEPRMDAVTLLQAIESRA